jgi:ATP-dependent DNA helicase RecQ
MKKVFKENRRSIKFIAVDEAHCLLSWGESKFRPAFLEIQTLRSILLEAKCIALTTTASIKCQSQIALYLRMREPKFFRVSPEKFNINIIVKKLSSKPNTFSVHDYMDGLLDDVIRTV